MLTFLPNFNGDLKRVHVDQFRINGNAGYQRDLLKMGMILTLKIYILSHFN